MKSIRCTASVLGMFMAATSAYADLAPRFDESLGFTVLGVTPAGLLVDNAGTSFNCGVDEVSERVLALSHCQAILGPMAAAAAAAAEENWLMEQEGVADLLGELPDQVFAGAIRAVMARSGCVLDGTNEEALRAWFLPAMGVQLGLQSPFSEDILDALDDRVGDGAEILLETGEVVLNVDDTMATLVNCTQ